MFKFSTDSMEMINVLIVLNLLKILAKLIPEIKENMRGFKCNKLSHRVKYWVMKINKINHINSWRFHMSFTICIFHVNARNIWSSNHTNHPYFPQQDYSETFDVSTKIEGCPEWNMAVMNGRYIRFETMVAVYPGTGSCCCVFLIEAMCCRIWESF